MAQWPGVRLRKTNTEMAHISGYVENKFQSSSFNSFGCTRPQTGVNFNCCKNNNNNNNNNNNKKDSTDFVIIIKMPTEVGIFN